jgi:hypothetical protein
MENFFEELKKYFESTPKDKILSDWEKTKDFDNIGLTVDEFININKIRMERFEIKEEHLKLLNRSYVSWDDSEFGAACIYPKKPYGNSDVEYDIAKILGWEIKDDELTDEQISIANKLHEETETALQICLSRLKFETGVYENSGYGIKWVKVS